MVVTLQVWLALVLVVMAIYAVRQYVLTARRFRGHQRPYYQDLIDGDLPGVTIVIPMHNEELVATGILNLMVNIDYPKDRLEVIPVDDHSDDSTAEILQEYARNHDFIKPIWRRQGLRGKPAALNDALLATSNEVILVFDADYRPSRDIVRQLAMAFKDPEVGGVMGRVVPRNVGTNLLTRLLDLERSGGYQVDQQARYSLNLFPQYGGTVGGFRRSVALSWGGFDPKVLAEDTDLTFRLYARGWKVAYANGAECYEQVPETWDGRFRQLRRWARGHTQVLIRHWFQVIRSPHLGPAQKLDALLLLGIYSVPPILLSGIIANFLLFLAGSHPLGTTLAISFFGIAFSGFGNFASFYQVGAAAVLDGTRERILLLPFLSLMFLYNNIAVTTGVLDALIDLVKGRTPAWDKTQRVAT